MEDQNTNLCNICMHNLNEIQDDIAHTDHCGHKFHKNCVIKWLADSEACPNCRSIVLWIEYFQNGEKKQINLDELQQQSQKSIQKQESQQTEYVDPSLENEQNIYQSFDIQFLQDQVFFLSDLYKQCLEYASNNPSQDEDQKWFIMEDLENRIYDLKNTVNNDMQIESENLLIDIQEMNQQLQLVKSNRWKELFDIYKNIYQEYQKNPSQNQFDIEDEYSEDECYIKGKKQQKGGRNGRKNKQEKEKYHLGTKVTIEKNKL